MTNHSVQHRVEAVVGTGKSPEKFPQAKISLLSTGFVNPPPQHFIISQNIEYIFNGYLLNNLTFQLCNIVSDFKDFGRANLLKDRNGHA